jgi:hypothetical protein
MSLVCRWFTRNIITRLQILCTWMKAKDFGPLGRTAGVRKRTTMNLRKKTRPTTRLIEAMLDLALLAGFISTMGFLVRLAF